MITKLKVAAIVTAAAVGIVSPAFAQSFDPDDGTGNAFATAPQSSDQPVVTGGGSLGYNENVKND